jgi:hypothetical protein
MHRRPVALMAALLVTGAVVLAAGGCVSSPPPPTEAEEAPAPATPGATEPAVPSTQAPTAPPSAVPAPLAVSPKPSPKAPAAPKAKGKGAAPALVAVSAAGRRITGVMLQGAAFDFAYDPQAGSLLAVAPVAGTVTLYPKAYLEGANTSFIGPVAAGKYPSSAVWKRYKDKTYFVVGPHYPGDLRILDAATLEVAQSVAVGPLDFDSSCLMGPVSTSTDPNDPYVYYSYRKGPSVRAARISLVTFQDEGDLGLGEREYFESVRISPDGQRLYVQYATFWRLAEPDAEAGAKGRWRLLNRGLLAPAATDPFGFFCTDPSNHSVGCGKALFTADLRTMIAKLDFAPFCIFPDRPVMVGFPIGDYKRIILQLTAASCNTLKDLGRLTLTNVLKAPPEPPDAKARAEAKPFPFKFRCFADPAGARVLVAYADKAMLVPLADLGVEEEPSLTVRLELPRTAIVDEPLRLPVKLPNPTASAELKDAPAGMTLHDGLLTWTPTPANLGTVSFAIEVRDGDHSQTQPYVLTVTRRSVVLGFTPTNVFVSPSGKWVVAMAKSYREAAPPGAGGPVSVPMSRVALVDVNQRRVLADRKLLYEATTAAVDDEAVYVAPLNAKAVDKFSLNDLSFVQRVEVPAQVLQMTSVSSKVLAVSTDDGILLLASSNLKDMEDESPLAKALARIPVRSAANGPAGRLGFTLVHPLPDGWSAGYWCMDPDFSKVTLITAAIGWPALYSNSSVLTFMEPHPWGRYWQSGQLMSSAGERIGDVARERQVDVLSSQPLAVVLTNNPDRLDLMPGHSALNTAKGYTGGWALILKDLVRGKEIGFIPLTAGPVPGTADPVAILTCAGDKICVLLGTSLFFETPDAETLKKAETPLELLRPREIVVIRPGTSARLEHKVRGGTPPYEFSLTPGGVHEPVRKGIAIDPTTGVVTVTASELVKPWAIDALRAYNGPKYQMPVDRAAKPPPPPLPAERVRQLREQFHLMTGRTLDGVPVCVPLQITVADKKGQQALLYYQVVVEVSEALAIEAFKAASPPVSRPPVLPPPVPPLPAKSAGGRP